MTTTDQHQPNTQLPLKPLLRGWLHLGFSPIALIAGLALTTLAPTLGARIACAVYTLAAVQLFATSAAYHRGNWKPDALALFRRVDHANIFVFIAGATYPAPIALAMSTNVSTKKSVYLK